MLFEVEQIGTNSLVHVRVKDKRKRARLYIVSKGLFTAS